MFRKRPFRRPRLTRLRLRRPHRAPEPGHPLQPRVPPALARANSLMADEQFGDAAAIYARLSEGARERGMLVRAGDLALQAARAHFAAADEESALQWAREGMRLLIRGGRAGRVARLLPRITSTLRENGHDAEADQLEQEAAQELERMGLSLDALDQREPQATERRGTLPSRCSGCGAPLVPGEVEWHDTRTAECPYCGTVAKAT